MGLYPALLTRIQKRITNSLETQRGRRPRRRHSGLLVDRPAAIVQELEQRVLPTNMPPMITANQTTFMVSHDQTLNVTTPAVTGSDMNGDPITLQLVSGPSHGGLTLNPNATFSYVPTAQYVGSDTFQVRYVDSLGAASNTVTISLNVTNMPPNITANQTTFMMSHDRTLNVTTPAVTGADFNGDPLTLQLVNGPAHGSLTLNSNGTFSYTPTAQYVGSDTFQVRYVDSLGAASNTVTISLNVTNMPPNITANQTTFMMSHDRTLNVTTPAVTGADFNGDPLTLQLVNGPAHGSLTLNSNGTFSYTPTAQYVGPDSFQVRYVDNLGAASNTVTISLSVTNMPPNITANQTTFMLSHDQTLNVTTPAVTGTDFNGDPLTLQLVSGPAHGSLTLNPNGTFSYTPTAQYVGPDAFQVRYVDNLGAVSNTVTISLSVMNMSPTFAGGTTVASVHENTVIGTTVLTSGAMDMDDPVLTYSIVSGNGAGYFTLDSATGAIKVASALNYEAMTQHQFNLVVRATDSLGATASRTVTLNVTDVNEPPTLLNFNVSTTNGSVYTFTGQVSDEWPAGCGIIFDGLLQGHQVSCDPNGTFTYTVTLGGGATGLVFGKAVDGNNLTSPNSFVLI